MAQRSILILIFKVMLLQHSSQAVRVDKFGLSDAVEPEKGNDITMKCDITISASDEIQPLNILKGTVKVTTCILYAGGSPTCSDESGIQERYEVKYSQSSAIISITNLQISDGGAWYCGFQASGNTLYTLSVYASPENIVGIGSADEGDLQSGKVSLSCSTSNCVFPSVGMYQWFYKKGTVQWLLYQNSTPSSSQTGCSGSEIKYSSTLHLPRFTVWPLQPSNIETTVKFKCRLDFPTLQSPLESAISGDVTYAVRVISVILKDGNKTPSNSNIIEVITGETKTLMCVTSTSRPVATIVWYIGLDVKQRNTSTEYIYSPKYEDNRKQIYCKAFNIQPEVNAVSSNTPTLHVRVTVTDVTLFDGDISPQDDDTIKVTEDHEKTLTCRTGESNPPSIIMWFINDLLKHNGTNVNFKFTPTNKDHDKKIQCKAYNIQPQNEAVVSASPKLFVKVLATTPTILNQTTGNFVMFENDTVSLECISSATRPAVIVSWKKGTTPLTNVHNTTISTGDLVRVKSIVTFTPNRADDAKTIYCQTYIPTQINTPSSISQKIVVYWPPFTPSISMTEFPFLESQTGKSLYCSSTEYGNPAATATWNSTIGSPNSSDSRELNLPTLTSQHDGLSVSCQLKNFFTQLKGSDIRSKLIEIAVEYTPISQIIVEGNVVQSVTKIEGQNLTAFCNATGNPSPTVKWIGQTSDREYLQFIDIDRNKHGSYTCRATATSLKYQNHNFVTENTIQVAVNYAPKVDVVIDIEEPTENSSLYINCTPSGRPAVYYVTSMVQTFGGRTIHNTHVHVNGILEIPNLQLQDSGTYTCTANNGIRDRNHQLDQTGDKTMRLKVSPKVLLNGLTFAGAPGKSINITVPFYSYPYILHVKFRLPNGSEIHNSDKHKVYYESQKVTTKFYGTDVELDGYIAVLRIKDEEEADFVDYVLELGNKIQPLSQWTLHHVSESIPLVPKFINFTGIDGDVPTFLLLGNFNGGRQQTFVIETSTKDSDIWVEKLRFNETDMNFLLQTKDENLMFRFNITGLSANTYIARVLSGNDLGWINESSAPTTRFTLNPTEDVTGPTMSAIIGGAAGGGSAIVLVVVVVVVVVFLKRKGYLRKGKAAADDNKSDRRPVCNDENEYGMQDNPMYESAGPRNADLTVGACGSGDMGAVYSTVDKKKLVETNKNDVYAEVDKSKKTKANNDVEYSTPVKPKGKDKKEKTKHGFMKEKKGKKGAQEGDLYENANELKDAAAKQKNVETIYENPEPSKASKKKNVNKDGLIYADITFNDQPKGQKKLVIHGLDSMTEYVEVDFTKKADPLPDSDDENNSTTT